MNKRLFSETSTLIRFIFKRDKVSLTIWILSIVSFAVLFVPVLAEYLTDNSGNSIMAEMMKNPAMVAMVGPYYGGDTFTFGASYVSMMMVFSVMIAGVMNVFLISRHTLQDEELGRFEILRSLPIGRISNLAAALITAAISDTILSLISGVGMYLIREDDMTFKGCMIFGASLGVVGIFFASATALFCQCTSNNRTALGLSMFLLFTLYIMRGIGDVSFEILSLISPLGLVLRTKCFVKDLWYPVFIILGISAVLSILAMYLAVKRDLGSGLFPEKAGKRHAAKYLSSPYGLALKLLKSSIVTWVVVIFVLSAMYGSVFGEFDSFLASNEMLKAIFSANPDYSMAEQFISLLMAIMSMIVTIPVIAFINRVSSEEKHGFSENVLCRSVSRGSQLMAYFLPSFVSSIVLQLISAFGFWSVGSMAVDNIPDLQTFVISAVSYLPAIWFMLGISFMMITYLPSMTSVPYYYLGYSAISIYIGTVANFPEWLKKLTPFGYVSQYPIEEIKMLPLIILTLIFVTFVMIGFYGYRKRDYYLK